MYIQEMNDDSDTTINLNKVTAIQKSGQYGLKIFMQAQESPIEIQYSYTQDRNYQYNKFINNLRDA